MMERSRQYYINAIEECATRLGQVRTVLAPDTSDSSDLQGFRRRARELNKKIIKFRALANGPEEKITNSDRHDMLSIYMEIEQLFNDYTATSWVSWFKRRLRKLWP